MIYEINYANELFSAAQKYHVKMAKKRGKFDKIIAYNPDMLETQFKEENKEIYSKKKGGGFWIWKSHIINMTLKQMQMGDYVLYCDAGAVIQHPVTELIKVIEKNQEEIMVFEVYGHLEKYWTKRDVFTYFDCESDAVLNSNQIMGGFILIKKTEKTIAIFEEYEKACITKRMITDDGNELGKDNYEGFCENRHDQSILSVLLKKNGVVPYRDPSQFGLFQKVKYKQKNMNTEIDYKTYERSTYPLMMFFLHRMSYFSGSGLRFRYEVIKSYISIVKKYICYYIYRKREI